MPAINESYSELTDVVSLAKRHGRCPKSGPVVVDEYRSGNLQDVGIGGLHVIGELLDRIAELKDALDGVLEDDKPGVTK